MALTSLCFDTKMKAVLRKYRVELVSSLQVDDLLDHLIRDHVFECDDYIKAEKTRQDKVRKLLEDLQKRPASDFWKFIQAMISTQQSHLAEKLIQEYKHLGGVVPLVTSSQHEHPQQPTERGRRNGSPYHEWSDGRVVTSPCDATTSDSEDHRQSRQQNTNRTGVGDRHGTVEDAEALRNLLIDLDFEIQMKRNCSAEEMRNTLQNFALSLSGREIDACIVAVLSHGRRNEEILGTDGQVVTTSEMRHYFGNQLCPTMAGKPKLFIIQACKGDMEDTLCGQRRHVQGESLADVEKEVFHQPAVPRPLPDNADICFLYATVEGFVAYRNVFIRKLCEVFRANADKFHVKEIATLLNSEMASLSLDGRLTMSEDRGSLTKFWYLNPPSSV
ncbi:caspase-14-like isoform X2 [Pomacea canaliculata]|uniref:caspase-14-like isoform X2 n=1 Tax=Pomacea canaliculata TaxID=400727 RepID=UPI000D738905|nr:caspase-14-like isoform X2 [Pomacea canaliculata]